MSYLSEDWCDRYPDTGIVISDINRVVNSTAPES